MKPNGKTPVSNKVSNGTLIGLLSALVMGTLEYFIPAWHHGIPGPAQYFISAGVGAAGMFLGGFFSSHQATVTEIEKALSFMKNMGSLVDQILGAATPKAEPVVASVVAPAMAETAPVEVVPS